MPASFHVFGHMWQRSSKLFQSLVNQRERRIAPRATPNVMVSRES